MNILAELKKSVTPELVEVVSTQIAEDSQKTKTALESYMSVLLGSFMKCSATEMGARSILNHIEKESFDGTLSASMSGKLTSESIKKMGEKGSSLFSLLTPDKKSIIISSIASFAKIRNSSSVTLLGIATPLVLDGIGKMGNAKNLDPIGLMTFLSDHREDFTSQTGTTLLEKTVEILGIKDYLAAGTTISPQSSKKGTSSYEDNFTDDNAENKGLLKYVLIGGLILLLAGAGIYWYMNRPNVQEAEVQPTEEVLVTPDSLTTSPAPDTLSTSPTVAKDTTQGTEIVTKPVVAAPIPKVDASLASLTKGGLAEQFATYLADTSKITGKVFSYGNLEFDPASANLSTASDAKIAELVKVLGKYPNAQVKIMGYVSKTADSLKAKTLSFKRANAVKMLIVAKGVNIIRIDAVGRGRSTAVPRIDLKVIRK